MPICQSFDDWYFPYKCFVWLQELKKDQKTREEPTEKNENKHAILYFDVQIDIPRYEKNVSAPLHASGSWSKNDPPPFPALTLMSNTHSTSSSNCGNSSSGTAKQNKTVVRKKGKKRNERKN